MAAILIIVEETTCIFRGSWRITALHTTRTQQHVIIIIIVVPRPTKYETWREMIREKE